LAVASFTGSHAASGVYLGYYATAIGAESTAIVEFLEKNYSQEMDTPQCVELALRALSTAMESIDVDRIEVAYGDVKSKAMRKMSKEELAPILARIKK